MDIAYFPNHVAKNGESVLAAMIESLRYRGHRMCADVMDADAAVIWSMLWAGRMRANHDVFQHYRDQDKPVLVLEIGCLRRGHTWKVGINGTLPRSNLAVAGTPSRRDMLGVNMLPWRQHRGDNIVVSLQRSQSHYWQGMPEPGLWAQNIITTVREFTDRPIVIRPHPRQRLQNAPWDCSVISPQPVPNTYDDFDFISTLNSTWAVINHNSHPGVQSVIHGVPAFVDSSSLAAPVANLGLDCIESPEMPDRDVWFEDLLWTEFLTEEIRHGLPLDLLGFA